MPAGLVVEKDEEAALVVFPDELLDEVTLLLEHALAELDLVESEGANRGGASRARVTREVR